MNLDDYQKDALKSVAITEKNLAALAHRTLGLTGESGQVANMVKKIIRDKDGAASPEDVEAITEKLGDALYYVAVLSEYFGKDLSEVAAANLEKSRLFSQKRTQSEASLNEE